MRRSGRRPKLWFCQFGHHQRGTRPPQPKRIAAKWAVLRFDGPVDRENTTMSFWTLRRSVWLPMPWPWHHTCTPCCMSPAATTHKVSSCPSLKNSIKTGLSNTSVCCSTTLANRQVWIRLWLWLRLWVWVWVWVLQQRLTQPS